MIRKYLKILIFNYYLTNTFFFPFFYYSAHTLNLLATVDIASVPGWNPRWQKTSGKAQGLWNLQNRSSVMANKVQAAIQRKLVTPGQTRWNSYFDAINALLKVFEHPTQLDAINALIINHGRLLKTPFNDIDIRVSD